MLEREEFVCEWYLIEWEFDFTEIVGFGAVEDMHMFSISSLDPNMHIRHEADLYYIIERPSSN